MKKKIKCGCFFENFWHPSLLIDLKLKGHLHHYKLHQIFQSFMGFHMVPLLKRMVWLKFLYIQKTDELLLETVECSDWWKIYFYKKILYKRKSCKGFFCKNKFSTNESTAFITGHVGGNLEEELHYFAAKNGWEGWAHLVLP